jgi:hypothetical protein
VQKLPDPVQPAASGGMHTQDWEPEVPEQVWCALQAAVLEIVTQWWASSTHVVTLFGPPVQNVPAMPPVQSPGAGLQAQAPRPSPPMQVSLAVHDVGPALT